jgi:undecaprenyl diphosphate synthase
MDLVQQINFSTVPQHIAVIMDGNGRWAKNQGQERLYGHNYGVESVREVLKGAMELKVKFLTLYAFSTENWSRPKEEVEGLMDLLIRTIAGEVEELNERGIGLQAIGNLEGLPAGCHEALNQAIQKTAHNKETTLILALNYSARWEILEATKKISEEVKSGKIESAQIDAAIFEKALTTTEIPHPELLIRTSGEHRISNFLLWQIAYSEFYFTEVLWPDFKKEDLFKAVIDYQSRERRFGLVSEQIVK